MDVNKDISVKHVQTELCLLSLEAVQGNKTLTTDLSLQWFHNVQMLEEIKKFPNTVGELGHGEDW